MKLRIIPAGFAKNNEEVKPLSRITTLIDESEV